MTKPLPKMYNLVLTAEELRFVHALVCLRFAPELGSMAVTAGLSSLIGALDLVASAHVMIECAEAEVDIARLYQKTETLVTTTVPPELL